MTDLEARQRAAVAAETRRWIGARYHHMARVRPDPAMGEKGATDCAQLLACVYRDAGLIPEVPVVYYPPDWHLHRGFERYMGVVLAYARETENPKPGDVVLYKWGRCFAHGAIVVDPGWPHIVHAIVDAGAVISDRGDGGRLKGRERRFFTLW